MQDRSPDLRFIELWLPSRINFSQWLTRLALRAYSYGVVADLHRLPDILLVRVVV